MRRRALLGSLAAGTVVGSAGCLTTLGLAERGPVTAKFVVRVTDTETGNILIDSVEGERQIAEEHRDQFPAEGRIFVSSDLDRRLRNRYRDVQYRVRHECCEPARRPAVSRGDFNSLGLGDTASLSYSESGDRATVVGISQAEDGN
jgi:hypothetical protein